MVAMIPRVDQTLIFIVPAPGLGLVLGFTIMLRSTDLSNTAPSGQQVLPKDAAAWRRRIAGARGNDGRSDGHHRRGSMPGDYIPLSQFFGWYCGHAAISLARGGRRRIITRWDRVTRRQRSEGSRLNRRASRCYGTAMGVPVSTTHTIKGAIIGVGSTRVVGSGLGIAGDVWASILTIPMAAATPPYVYSFTSPACGLAMANR